MITEPTANALTPEIRESILEALQELIITEILSDEAVSQLKAGAIPKRLLEPYAESVQRLSAAYVERKTTSKVTAEVWERDAEGYALYFTLINAAKFLNYFAELPEQFRSRELRVLDFGCGPATASLAALFAFPAISEIVGVERNPPMRGVAERLLRRSSRTPNKGFLLASTLENISGQFDLILCGNVFNEFDPVKATEFFETLCSKLSDDGMLVMVEPALKPGTHLAMQLRDNAVLHGLGVVFPCTHAAQCPMLQTDPENWCHREIEWTAPALVQQFDDILSFNKHRIKTAGFIFSKTPKANGGTRLLLDAEKSKRGLELFVCGPSQYGAMLISKKDERFTTLKKSRAFSILPT